MDTRNQKPKGLKPGLTREKQHVNASRPSFAKKAITAVPTQKRVATNSKDKRTPHKKENPREIALNVLMDVTRSDAYAQLALSDRLRACRLDRRDRNFVTELVYGTLERLITLDYHLDQSLERPDIDAVVRDILRLGLYQILYLDRVPDHAAVDECVKLARFFQRDAFVGLINGVLRSIVRKKEAGGLLLPSLEQDPAVHLSVAESQPLWIVNRLIETFGFEMAQAICQYRETIHPMTIRMTKERITTSAFETMMTKKGWSFENALIPCVYYVTDASDVGLDPAFQAGLYSVQNESSILAAMAVSPKPGQTILDACAAPGGKTAYLVEMMNGTGRVHAWDIHEHRVDIIRSMIQRLRLDTVRPAVRDASKIKEDWIQSIDAVLLDAPCSGLGVMLSKPDVRYRQSPDSVQSLVALQSDLLAACCQYVKPGGILVYSTCSILPEENFEQVKTFLKRFPQFELDTEGLRKALPAPFADRAENGMVQLFAHRDGVEGFFIARLKRVRP